MGLQDSPERILASYARSEAYVERTQTILARLGYRIVPADELAHETSPGSASGKRPEMLIVDESRWPEAAVCHLGEALPIILLTGRHGVRSSDPRIVGAVKRPAGLHDLYRLAQQVFEDHPRSTPRVRTELAVRCGRDGHWWSGSVLSLSENGCLLRSETEVKLGSCFDLELDLPETGRLSLRAEAAYQLLPDLGVVFSGLSHGARAAIGDFVDRALRG